MDWSSWIGREVFIRVSDGAIFSHSKVLAYEEPFISITDLFGYPVIINVNNILRIKEEGKNDRGA